VDVVLVVVPGFEEDVGMVFGDFEQFPLQIHPQTSVDHVTTVFGRNDEVIFAVVYAMVASAEFHAETLTWTRGRGERIHPTGLRPGVYERD